jgi:hypothetical protein
VADAVDECVVEITSLKALTLYHTLKRNDGTIWHVTRGAFEKVIQKPNCKTFAVAAAGFQAATYISPTVVTVPPLPLALASPLPSILISPIVLPPLMPLHLIFSQMPLQMPLL